MWKRKNKKNEKIRQTACYSIELFLGHPSVCDNPEYSDRILGSFKPLTALPCHWLDCFRQSIQVLCILLFYYLHWICSARMSLFLSLLSHLQYFTVGRNLSSSIFFFFFFSFQKLGILLVLSLSRHVSSWHQHLVSLRLVILYKVLLLAHYWTISSSTTLVTPHKFHCSRFFLFFLVST